MASLLSKLRDIFLPAPDGNLAFAFGLDIAHECLDLYLQINGDKEANKMSKHDKYRLIAVIGCYRLIFGHKPKTDKLIDMWLRRTEIRTFKDARTSMSMMAADDNLKVFEESMNVRPDVLELYANQESIALNLAIITGFIAEQRFMHKYKVETGDFFNYVPAIWAGVGMVIPPDI